MSSPFDDYGLATTAGAGSSNTGTGTNGGPRLGEIPIEERIRVLSVDDAPDAEDGHLNGSKVPLDDGRTELEGFWYKRYRSEAEDMDNVIRLVEAELSEPYVGLAAAALWA